MLCSTFILHTSLPQEQRLPNHKLVLDGDSLYAMYRRDFGFFRPDADVASTEIPVRHILGQRTEKTYKPILWLMGIYVDVNRQQPIKFVRQRMLYFVYEKKKAFISYQEPSLLPPVETTFIAPTLVQKLRALVATARYTYAPATWPLLTDFVPPHIARDLWISAPQGPHGFRSLYLYEPTDKQYFWSMLVAFSKIPKATRYAPEQLLNLSKFFSVFVHRLISNEYFDKVSIIFIPHKTYLATVTPAINVIKRCVYPKLRTFHRNFFVLEFIELMALAFSQPSAEILNWWFVRFMERIDARLHKRFINYFRVFLEALFLARTSATPFKGVKLSVKGKISVSGNAKKRKQQITCGTCSLSTKNHAISYSKKVIHTRTGVLGVKCYIFY